MKFRHTLILLGILAALVLFILLVERKSTPTAEKGTTPTATPLAQLFSFEPGSARALRVWRAGQEQRTELIYGEDGLWRLAAPVAEEADQEEVYYLLDALARLRPQRALAETADAPAAYELDPPRIQVEITLQDGSVQALLVGAATPTQAAYYAQVRGDGRVYLIPYYVGTQLEGILTKPPIKPTPTPAEAPSPLASATPAGTGE
jgi:hypothetical protein